MPTKQKLMKSLRPGSNFGSQIRKITQAEALKVVKRQSETKMSTYQAENQQLFHVNPWYHNNMLYTEHGTNKGAKPSTWTNRIGDELYLNSVNLRLHFFNKQDRPNVHYRVVMFWYEAGTVPNINGILDAQGNLMLARPNRESVSIIHDRVYPAVFPGPPGKEFSRIVRINKRWKGKKITYNDTTTANPTVPKFKDIGFMVIAYDAYGTLTTDNIGSFAYQYDVKFKEN